MLFQLGSVPLSPRTVECRSGECRQRLLYTKQMWAQLLFFGNDLLVYFDRNLSQKVAQMKLLEVKEIQSIVSSSPDNTGLTEKEIKTRQPNYNNTR